MVDKNKIRELWIEYFDTDQDQWKSGDVTINDDGSVSVDASVFLLQKTSTLPIKFNRVEWNFEAHGLLLKNLSNFPDYVGSDLNLCDNLLTNLVGAPSYVGKDLYLTRNLFDSLEGFPAFVGGKVTITWSENLPLLRSLTAPKIIIYGKPRAMVIMNKYAGQGKRAMFDCQKELEDAGFEGNAKW
jgi:hypothetical protein